jgi:hypothetical protein
MQQGYNREVQSVLTQLSTGYVSNSKIGVVSGSQRGCSLLTVLPLPDWNVRSESAGKRLLLENGCRNIRPSLRGYF